MAYSPDLSGEMEAFPDEMSLDERSRAGKEGAGDVLVNLNALHVATERYTSQELRDAQARTRRRQKLPQMLAAASDLVAHVELMRRCGMSAQQILDCGRADIRDVRSLLMDCCGDCMQYEDFGQNFNAIEHTIGRLDSCVETLQQEASRHSQSRTAQQVAIRPKGVSNFSPVEQEALDEVRHEQNRGRLVALRTERDGVLRYRSELDDLMRAVVASSDRHRLSKMLDLRDEMQRVTREAARHEHLIGQLGAHIAAREQVITDRARVRRVLEGQEQRSGGGVPAVLPRYAHAGAQIAAVALPFLKFLR